LLYADFCASFGQRALLRTWLMMHQSSHPRDLYAFKRREHTLDLDIARAELNHRSEVAREHERKQRHLRVLNFMMVRVTHLLLCTCLLASSVLLWLRLKLVVNWTFYIIFAPLFGFEAFLLASASVAFTIYHLRRSAGWTFYWNRLRGMVRWLIFYTSPWEGLIVLLLFSSVVPLLAFAIEAHVQLPRHSPLLALPFGAFWLASLFFTGSAIRRRSPSASCVGSFIILWLPLEAFSILLFLKCSFLPGLPAHAVLGPTLGISSLLLLFVGFLVTVSCWLGYRGNREWKEYATVTLLALVTLILPLLLVQLALLAYMLGWFPVDGVLIPWVVWISGVFLFALWHACTSSGSPPGGSASVDGYSGLDGYGYSLSLGGGQVGSSLPGPGMPSHTGDHLLGGPLRGGPHSWQPSMRHQRQHFLHVGDGTTIRSPTRSC
jgi:hypothetical protein